MNDTYYFSHDYNPRGDEKIQKLLFMHGWTGYGLYWALVELLYQNDGYMQMECERIAFELRTESELIESLINGFKLFVVQGKMFTSKSVLHRLKQRKGKSEQARQAAKARWHKEIPDDADALQAHSDSNALKESKVKESKVKETKLDFDFESSFFSVLTEWFQYKKDRKESYKSALSEKKFYTHLHKLSQGNHLTAQKIINVSMANNWAGVFQLKREDEQFPAYNEVDKESEDYKRKHKGYPIIPGQ